MIDNQIIDEQRHIFSKLEPQVKFLNLYNINMNIFEELFNYWISCVDSFRHKYLTKLNVVSFESYTDICLLAHSAIVLTMKSIDFGNFSLDAIYALTGVQHVSIETKYKKKFIFQSEICNTETLVFFAKIIQKKIGFSPISFEKAIYFALFCASITLNFNGKLDFIINHLKRICCISSPLLHNEISKINNYKCENELKTILANIDFPEDNFQFFIISYFFSTLFPYYNPERSNLYTRLLYDRLIDLSINEYIKILFYIPSEPVNVKFEEINDNKKDFFCLLCFKGSVILMKDEEFLNSISFNVDPFVYLYYSCFMNIDHLFICNFINRVIESRSGPRWNEIIQFLKSISCLLFTKEDLLKSSLNGNAEAAKNLLNFNDVFEHLQPKSHVFHEILFIYMNPLIPKIPIELDNILIVGTKLYCCLKNNYQANEQELDLLLSKLKTAIFNETNNISQNKTLTHCMFCGYAPFSFKKYENVDFPMVIDDFFGDWSNLQLLNCVLYLLLLLYKRNGIIPAPNIICCFSCHFLVHHNSKGLIQQFSSDEIRQESIKYVKLNLFEVLKIDNKTRKVCFLILNNLYKKHIDVIAESAFYLINKNDNFGFDILKSFDGSLEYIFNQFSVEKQVILIKRLLMTDQFMTFLPYILKIQKNDFYMELIINFIKDNLVLNPKLSLSIFKIIDKKENIIPLLISKISNLNIEYTLEFQKIILIISNYLPEKKNEENQNKKIDLICSSWNIISGSCNSNNSNLIDLWNINSTHLWKCTRQLPIREQPLFYCYTCGITNQFYCCLPCILSCHKGHDIVYVNNITFNCDCYSIPKMCLHNNSHSNITLNVDNNCDDGAINHFFCEQNNVVRDVERFSSFLRINRNNQRNTFQKNNNIIAENQEMKINKSILLKFYNMLLKLSTESIIEKIQKLESHHKKQYKTHKKNKILNIHQVLEKTFFLNSQEIFFDSLSPLIVKMIKKKTSYIPLNITAVCGYNNNILIVIQGNKIISCSLPLFQKIDSISFQFPILQILPNHIDQQFFLGVSINQVFIFVVSENGEIRINSQNMFEIPSNEYIISAYWVPLKPFVVGVLTQTKFQFIDVSENPKLLCLSLSLQSSSNNVFYSADIIEYKDESYIVMTFLNGGYSIIKFQKCDNDVRIFQFKKFPWNCKMPFISYSKESNLIFITGPSNDIICIKKEKFFDESFENLIYINTFDMPKDLCFCCTHPQNTNLHLFIHPLSGGIVGIEFEESQISISNAGFSFKNNRIPFQNQTITPLSFFNFEKHLYLLTTDYGISEIQINQFEMQKNINLNVSPLFWVYSQIITTGVNVQVFGIEYNCNYVLLQRTLIIPKQIMPKVINISLDSSQLVIVGFRIFINLQDQINNSPQEIQVFDRKISITSSRYYQIPLEPYEIGCKKSYQIKFNFIQNMDIKIEEINVFAFPLSKLNVSERKEVCWYDNNSSIFNYDEPEQEPTEIFNKVLYKTAKNFIDDDENIDEKIIENIIYSLYTNVKFSEISRIIVSRINKNKEKVLKIWINVITQVLKKNMIEKSLWKYLLRDIDCLPSEVKAKLKELLWNLCPPLNNSHLMSLAFM